MFSLHPPIARLKLSLRDRCVSSIKFLKQWPKSETFCERLYCDKMLGRRFFFLYPGFRPKSHTTPEHLRDRLKKKDKMLKRFAKGAVFSHLGAPSRHHSSRTSTLPGGRYGSSTLCSFASVPSLRMSAAVAVPSEISPSASLSSLSSPVLSSDTVAAPVQQCQLTSDARQFYNNSGPGGGRDRNWLLSQTQTNDNGITFTNHHFGIGSLSCSDLLLHPAATSSAPQGTEPPQHHQSRITAELHRLELAQADRLIDLMQPIDSGKHVLLDAGCGRGGTAFRIWQRSRPRTIYGITVAEDQQQYAMDMARNANISTTGALRFMVCNMLDVGARFPPQVFDRIYANETDMYIVDLPALYRGFFSRLRPDGGRFVLATWCCRTGEKYNPYQAKIDLNYGTQMHTEAEFLSALQGAGFQQITIHDLTTEAVPYWLLRKTWDHRSGVEQPFIDGYAAGSLKYLMITAERR